MITNNDLIKIADELGFEYGVNYIKIEWGEQEAFSIKYNRYVSSGNLVLFVSDYAKNAPRDVLKDLAEQVVARLTNHGSSYSNETVKWLKDNVNTKENVDLYCERHGFTQHDPRIDNVLEILNNSALNINPDITVVRDDSGNEMMLDIPSKSALFKVLGLSPLVLSNLDDVELACLIYAKTKEIESELANFPSRISPNELSSAAKMYVDRFCDVFNMSADRVKKIRRYI
jgi:hypothetical protein